jgi:hypothetical protein
LYLFISIEEVVVNYDHELRHQINVSGQNNTKVSLTPRELIVQKDGWNRGLRLGGEEAIPCLAATPKNRLLQI